MLALLHKRKIKINSNNTEAQSWYNSFYYDISIFVWVIQKVPCVCARSLYFFFMRVRPHTSSQLHAAAAIAIATVAFFHSIRFDSFYQFIWFVSSMCELHTFRSIELLPMKSMWWMNRGKWNEKWKSNAHNANKNIEIRPIRYEL